MNSDSSSAAGLAGALIAIWGVFALVGLGIAVFIFYCYWRIAEKAGFSGPLSLLMLIPGANLVLIVLFAFQEWPLERALRDAQRMAPPPPSAPIGGPPMNI
jgi:hypothetical protein